jgi:hypothetical protein
MNSVAEQMNQQADYLNALSAQISEQVASVAQLAADIEDDYSADAIYLSDQYGGVLAQFYYDGRLALPSLEVTPDLILVGGTPESAGLRIDAAAQTSDFGDLRLQRDPEGWSVVDSYGGVLAQFGENGCSSFSGFFFGADGYMAAPSGRPLYFEPFVTYSFEGSADAQDAVGATPITTPPVGVYQPIVTTDPFYYSGKDLRVMTSQQIPSIAAFPPASGGKYPRIVRANYGVSGEPPGTVGESNGCYVRVSYSDNNGETWIHAFFVVPEVVPTYNVLDPHVCALNDGRLLLTYPYSRSGRNVWGVIVENPTEPAASWVIGPQCYMGIGFVGRARYKPNGSLRGTLSEPMLGVSSPYGANQGAKYGYYYFSEGNTFSFNQISLIPPVEPGNINNDFQEVATNRVSGGKIRSIFRTQGSYYETYSADDGLTWGTPTPVTVQTASSRCDEAYSPSGRLVLVHNNSANREKIALSFTEVGGDGSVFEKTLVVDSLGNLSYPSITFGVDSSGGYDGYIYVAYDHGRGKTASLSAPTGYLNELILLRISEASIFSGQPFIEKTVVII